MLELIPPDNLGIKFLYEARTHPKIDEHLSGPPPENYLVHLEYMDKNRDKFRILADDYGYFGYCQINKDGEVGFVIHPDYQGKGLGKQLVELTIKEAWEMGFKKIYLLVKKDNLRAINIYENFGFRINEIVNSEYHMELNK